MPTAKVQVKTNIPPSAKQCWISAIIAGPNQSFRLSPLVERIPPQRRRRRRQPEKTISPWWRGASFIPASVVIQTIPPSSARLACLVRFIICPPTLRK